MPVQELEIGMFVSELDRPWLETSFMFQGFEIETTGELEELKKICEFVYVDMTKRRKEKPLSPQKKQKKQSPFILGPPPPKLGNFEREIGRAEHIIMDARGLVADFMDKIARGEGIDSKLAKQAVSECVNSVLHSPDAAVWLSQLKNRDEYTAQHSMNVCVLSIVLGRYVNLSVAELNRVGLCGMMHDMGKMLVPLNILNKPGRLDPDELHIMQTHTTLGYELLKSSHGMYPGAIDVAYSHHERLDRTGYPRKVSGEMITNYTRMVAIADMYDAITSDRVYHKGKTHLQATGIMSDLAGCHLDKALVEKFIESLGVYPPGCFVVMTNGDIAIVVEANPATKLRPKVIILMSKEKQIYEEKIIDLSAMGNDPEGKIYTIKNIVHAADYGIDPKIYYHKGFVQKGFAAAK